MAKPKMPPPILGDDTIVTIGFDEGLAAEQARVAKEVKTREASGFLDKAQAAFRQQGLTSLVLDAMLRPDFQDIPGYIPNPKKLQGLSADELAQVRDNVRSDEELDFELRQIEFARDDQRELGRSGAVVAFGASMVAGFPEAILTGKAFALPLKAAEMGATAASVASNVGGNILATAIEDAFSHRVSASDYVMGAAMGGLGVGLEFPGLLRASQSAEYRAAAQAMIADAQDVKARFNRQAVANLGEGAPPERLAAEATRLEHAALKAEQAAAVAPMDESRRLLPDMEKLVADEELALKAIEAPQSDRATSDAVGMLREAATTEPGKGTPILSPSLINEHALVPQKSAGSRDELAPKFRPQLDQFMAAHYQHNTGNTGRGGNLTAQEIVDLKPGVTVSSFVPKEARAAVEFLHKNFLGADYRLSIHAYREFANQGRNLGDAKTFDKNTSIVRIDFGSPQWAHTLVHEVGHVVFTRAFDDPRLKNKLVGFESAWREWLKYYTGQKEGDARFTPAEDAAVRRGSPANHYSREVMGVPANVAGFRASMMDAVAMVARKMDTTLGKVETFADGSTSIQRATKYIPNQDEFAAEQFVKYMEAAILKELPWKPVSVPKEFIDALKAIWDEMIRFFTKAKEAGLIKPDDRVVDLFEGVRKSIRADASIAKRVDAGLNPSRDTPAAPTASAIAEPLAARATATGPDISFLDSPIAAKYGLDKQAVDTPGRRAEAKAIIALYTRADNPQAGWNNIDPKRLDALTAKSANLGSTGLLMLKSENPVARMTAFELLESTTGAGGRRSSAALAKHLTERKLMGNIIPDLDSAYKEFRNANGGGIVEDYWGGKLWERFNRQVSEEIEARRTAGAEERSVNPAITRAADVVEAAYERLRVAQKDAKTTGWGGLPATSVGYMPHKMSAAKVRNMTRAQEDALFSSLVDQFIGTEGWDHSFSANLAAKYIDRVKRRATGGYESGMSQHATGAADMVEDALKAMGMAEDEVRAQMQKYMRGAAGHTKGRINLDLLREYTDEDGSTFRLMDMFETNQLDLVRQQAQRVSGEVALARHGIMGRPGLMLMRRAMLDFGYPGQKAQLAERDAFDQVAAEFLGDPFGNYGGKWMNRAMQMNSLVRLGGMGITQAAETINAAAHLGVLRALSVVGSFARLRKEAATLGKGGTVDNSILSSIETMGGAEFGTDAYKLVFPFDNPSMQYQVSGVDTANAADRLLRGGLHAQGKLSFWRAIHGAQQRGVAEQIVLKSLRFIRDGKDDIALADMGFTPSVRAAIQRELPNIATFDGQGKVLTFDITKMEDVGAAHEYIQAVHRGTSQIIQGTYIGETGKWAHEGYLKLLTQFRTFSLTSVEKQWSRNRANYGLASAVGIMMGSMAAAMPIYMARVYATSLNRPDREEYLNQRLSPLAMARASMNYVSMSGLAPDFMDALAGVAGYSTSGGRIGTGSEFVGSVVAPAAGLIDDMYKAVQNTREGTDLHGVVENLPFAKLPYLQPVINLLDE